MSYWFRMNFKEIEEKNLLDFCIMMSEECKKAATEILMNNKFYIPSIANNYDETSNKEYRRNKWSVIDRHWLYSLFTIQYIYWTDKKLLGIVGELPKSIKSALTTIEFQNSSDQDYEYDNWFGIKYFEKIVININHASAAQIACLMNDRTIYTGDEIAGDLEYSRKTAVYKIIYESLELDNWLWNKKGNFKLFSMQAINGREEQYELAQKMEVIRCNLLREI